MEKIAYFFNSDFEERLFSSNQKGFFSTKYTQEFEYFINFLNPKSRIYTTKKYSKDYLDYFSSFCGEDFKTIDKQGNVKNWCQSYENLDLLRRYQDKLNTLLYFKEKKIIKHNIQEVLDKSELKEGFLYKDPRGLSGIGHYHYPRDKKKLEKLLNQTKIIQEKRLERVMDFSTLFKEQKVIAQYENLIDDFYQYKGTLIRPNQFLEIEIDKSYAEALIDIQEYTKPYGGIYSVDSFLYREKDEILLQPICELNMRKTMGYIAVKLKEKYFQSDDYFKLFLRRNKKSISNEDVYSKLGKRAQLISPSDNIFQVWLIAAKSEKELMEKESKLNSTFF